MTIIELLLIVCVSITAMILLAYRKGWLFPDLRFLPASAPPPSRVARIVEAAVLGISGCIIVLATAPRSQSTGCYGNLSEFVPKYATLHIILFVGALAGVGLAALVALWGRTKASAIILGILLIGYGITLNNLRDPSQSFPPKQMGEPVIKYTIDLGDTNAKGADLWVNGVYLGKTPYTTTVSEFEAKVPYWPKLPAEYEKEKFRSVHYEPRYSGPDIRGRWLPFSLSVCVSLPNDVAKLLKHSAHPGKDSMAYYYANVRYAGEWGTGGGSSGGGTPEYSHSEIDVLFRERQKRLDTLLNMARLANYRVGPEWFQTAETYNGDVWLALGKAVEGEPQMAEVRDAWATWRYGLDKAADPDSAWTVFQRICDEAEAKQQYATDSVTGRAVELLVPKLPRQRLVDKALPLIRQTGSRAWSYGQSNGRYQFAYGPLDLDYFDISFFSGIRVSLNKSPRFPAGGFPVAHAVWMLDELFRSTGQPQPNIIQQQIVPEIVRWHGKDFNTFEMLIASHFGGPTIDKFVLRQNWGSPPDPVNYGDWLYVSSKQVNMWLYYLAYLNDFAGREYHREHADLIMAMADNIYSRSIIWQDNIDFIFMDPCLAKEYWPRFSRLVQASHSPLMDQWHYLMSMGDAATVDMFVEAWKNTRVSPTDYFQGFDSLDKLKLPMRRQVIRALMRQVRADTTNLAAVWKSIDGRTDAEKKDSVILKLKSSDKKTSRLSEAEKLLADLQKKPGKDNQSLGRNVPLWLEHTQPDSPLVAMLADADKPALRLMVMGALREYPTPRNQALLEKLLKDPDAAVRKAAEAVSQQLKKLAGQKPAEYASDATSAPSNLSTISPSAEKD
jgi:hypothetical protein